MSAIERFLRPVTYQGFPDELLPSPLREANTLHLWRLVDGELTRLTPPPVPITEQAPSRHRRPRVGAGRCPAHPVSP